jgi:aromatic-L-amino-acid decarboxylase
MQLRWFGLDGLRRRIERHIEEAQRFAAAIDADPDWERLAPAPFSTVCFRYRPSRLAGHEDEPEAKAWLDDTNTRLMDGVNRSGQVFLSHTRLRDRFTIRLAIGNLRTEPRHVDLAWALLRDLAATLDTDTDTRNAR